LRGYLYSRNGKGGDQRRKAKGQNERLKEREEFISFECVRVWAVKGASRSPFAKVQGGEK